MGHDKLFQKRKAALERKVGTRNPRLILIVCEGERTEPNYFRAFPVNPEVFTSIDVQGTGYNTLSLVREAIRLRDSAQEKLQPYIETWCVFDKDSFPDRNFNDAITLAGYERIKCAYSIEAFELWYILHFQYCDSQLHRSQYKDLLTKQLSKPYAKNDPSMYKAVLNKQRIAIKRAKKLYQGKANLPCRLQNPVTTVFKLVERLNGN